MCFLHSLGRKILRPHQDSHQADIRMTCAARSCFLPLEFWGSCGSQDETRLCSLQEVSPEFHQLFLASLFVSQTVSGDIS